MMVLGTFSQHIPQESSSIRPKQTASVGRQTHDFPREIHPDMRYIVGLTHHARRARCVIRIVARFLESTQPRKVGPPNSGLRSSLRDSCRHSPAGYWDLQKPIRVDRLFALSQPGEGVAFGLWTICANRKVGEISPRGPDRRSREVFGSGPNNTIQSKAQRWPE